MHEQAWRPILNNPHPGRNVAHAQLPSMTLKVMATLTHDPLWFELVPELSMNQQHPLVPQTAGASAITVQAEELLELGHKLNPERIMS